MKDLQIYLENIKLWTEMDVCSPKTKQIILSKIEEDKKNPHLFNIHFYLQYQKCFSELGKTNLDVIEVSKPWKKAINVVNTVVKLKKNLKRHNEAIIHPM